MQSWTVWLSGSSTKRARERGLKAVRRPAEEAAPKGRRLIISSDRDSTQGLAVGQSN